MKNKIKIEYVKVSELKSPKYNPRRWTPEATAQLTESIKRFGFVDPLLINKNPARKGIIIGGNFRKSICKELGILEVPCVFVDIADIEKEKELNGRLNRNTGEWDYDLLKLNFSEDLLKDIGFENSLFDKLDKELCLKEIYEVVIECKDEIEQEKTYNKIKGMGYKCRILIS